MQQPTNRNFYPKRSSSIATPVRCNRCSQPLSATFYALTCNCLLCEECTTSHFAHHSNCPIPSCNRALGEDDFRELHVARPPMHVDARQSTYKRLMVKLSVHQKDIDMVDLWNRLQRQFGMHREGLKFAYRQFLKESTAQTRRSLHMRKALQQSNEEHIRLKQAINKQKEITEALNRQLIISRDEIVEKDRQLMNLRKTLSSNIPPTPMNTIAMGSEPGRRTPNSGLHQQMCTEIDRSREDRPRRVSDQYMTNTLHNLASQSEPIRHDPYQNRYQRHLAGGSKELPMNTNRDGSYYHGAKETESYSVYNPYKKAAQSSSPVTQRGTSNRRLNGNLSLNPGGRIRNVTARSDYTFKGGRMGRKRPFSASPTTYGGSQGSRWQVDSRNSAPRITFNHSQHRYVTQPEVHQGS